MSSHHKLPPQGDKERTDIYISMIVVSLFLVFGYMIVMDSENVESINLDDPNTSQRISSNTITLNEEVYEIIELDEESYNTREVVAVDQIYERKYQEFLDKTNAPQSLALSKEEFSGSPILEETIRSIDSLTNRTSVEVENTDVVAIGDNIVENSDGLSHKETEVVEPSTNVPDESVISSDTESIDCRIIIGGFAKRSNVESLINRLADQGYDHFTTPWRGLTQVGVHIDCNRDISTRALSQIQRDYADDAFLVKKK